MSHLDVTLTYYRPSDFERWSSGSFLITSLAIAFKFNDAESHQWQNLLEHHFCLWQSHSQMRSVWAMPRVAPISACSSPPWNIPQGCGWYRGDTKLIDLHWTPQSCCHQGYFRKALRFHLQHLSVSSVYVKIHGKKKIKPNLVADARCRCERVT